MFCDHEGKAEGGRLKTEGGEAEGALKLKEQ